MTVTEAAGDAAADFRRAQSGVNRAQAAVSPAFNLFAPTPSMAAPSGAASASATRPQRAWTRALSVRLRRLRLSRRSVSRRLGQAGPLPPSLIRHSSLTPRQHPPATLQPSAPAHRDPLGVWLGSAPRLPTLRHYPGRGSTAPKAAALSRRGPSLWAGAWRATRSGS